MPFYTVAAAFDAPVEVRDVFPFVFWVDHLALDEAGQHELARELLAAGAHRVHSTPRNAPAATLTGSPMSMSSR